MVLLHRGEFVGVVRRFQDCRASFVAVGSRHTTGDQSLYIISLKGKHPFILDINISKSSG